MRRCMQLIVAVVPVFVLVWLVSVAEAVNITKAEVQNGFAVVEGNKTLRQAHVSWEGQVITQTNKGGSFSFADGEVPADCRGTLRIADEIRDETVEVLLSNCEPIPEPAGGVLRTGQMTCYDSDDNHAVVDCELANPAGQDGELQMGVPRSYTDNGNRTITDNVTRLMWEKLLPADGSGGGNCNLAQANRDPSCVNNLYTWTQAFEKVAALNTEPCLAGHCDWRLPNVNELQSIADYGRTNPSIDPTFGPTSASNYWSSTTLVSGGPDFAWRVFFFHGLVSSSFNKTNSIFVRAVRGGS